MKSMGMPPSHLSFFIMELAIDVKWLARSELGRSNGWSDVSPMIKRARSYWLVL